MKNKLSGTKTLRYWKIFWVVFISYSFVMPIARSINRKLPPELPIIMEVPSFQSKDQFGQAFSTKERASILIDTREELSDSDWELLFLIQKRIKGVSSKLYVATFSHDNQETRNKMTIEKKINPFVWKMLESDDAFSNLITKLSLEGSFSKPILLVDENGKLRRHYSLNKYDINMLMIDIGLLINRQQFSRPLIKTIKESFKR